MHTRYAPWVNFVTRMITSTVPHIVRPTALTTRERIIRARTFGSDSVRSNRVQWRTMPVWPSVNEMNTPTM